MASYYYLIDDQGQPVLDAEITYEFPEKQDLLGLIVNSYPEEIKEIEPFIEWLYESQLIETSFTLEQIKRAEKEWRDREIVAEGLEHFYSVYTCAYWLVNCSELIQSKSAE